MRNLELKVAVDAPAFDAIAQRARLLGKSRTITQIDTYFAVPSGRLKLRETSEGPNRGAELIGYARPDIEGARWSEYYRADLRPEQIGHLIAMMKKTIGVRAVVSKQREVVLTSRTRIHLDQVEGLGRYIELETVVGDDDDAGAKSELAGVSAMLGLGDHPAIAGSYSDLIDSKQPDGEERA